MVLSQRAERPSAPAILGWKASTTGLGYGTSYEDTSERKLQTNMVRTFDEESLICSLFDKKRQNLFLTWENTMAFDTTWNNVIYQLSPELFKFHVNAIEKQI